MMDSPAIEKKSLGRRVLRWLLLFVLAVAAVLTIAHFAWKYSGSGNWVQVIDKNGIEIYARKTPGSTLKDFRAVTRVKTRLTTAVASLASDSQEEDCSTWVEGCIGQVNVIPYDRHNLTVTDMFTVEYPSPFKPREFLIAMEAWQDPESKSVTIDYQVAPDLLPRNDCCYRVPDMHNVWVFTPLEDGEVGVDYTTHIDQGIPYLMFNRIAAYIVYELIEDLPSHFDKYQDAQLEGISD